MRINGYIDGFNLWYGALRGGPNRWLDVFALLQRIAPNATIGRVRYFSAMVNGYSDPNAPLRQETYLRALRTNPNVDVHLGHFLTRPKTMHLAHPIPGGPTSAVVLHTEEKGSDVNIATHLLLDAFAGEFDEAIVISNDSDLAEPIRLVNAQFAPVGVIKPNKLHSANLKAAAAWYRPLFPSYLKSCQLPSTLQDAQGVITKPTSW